MHEGENAEVSATVGASAGSGDECVDDSVDTSTRGRLIEALTEAVREALAEGDGETAQVAIRALEELARRIDAPEKPERVEGDRNVESIETVERDHGHPPTYGWLLLVRAPALRRKRRRN